MTGDPSIPVGPAPDAPVRIETFDVSGLPEQDRFPALVAANQSSRLTRLSDGPFNAEARFWQMGEQVWVDQWLDPLAFERDEAMARSLQATHYSIIVLLAGEIVLSRTSRDVPCTAGDVIVTDLSRPEAARATRMHSLHIRIPRGDVDAILPPVEIHGRLPRSVATRLFVDHAAGVATAIDELTEVQATVLAAAACRLFAAALSGLPVRTAAMPDHSARERATRYIAERPSGALDVAAMCADLGMTRATLYRAFIADGGVLTYDRKRRLVALHQAITDPAEYRSLIALGRHHGFADKSHLSRVFREAFGYTPSELRAHATARSRITARPGSVQDRFRAMVAALR